MHSPAIRCSTSDTSYSLYYFVDNKALFAVVSLDLNVPLVSGCGDSQIKAQLLHVYLEKPQYCRHKLQPILVNVELLRRDAPQLIEAP
jgi:hypothetical protein